MKYRLIPIRKSSYIFNVVLYLNISSIVANNIKFYDGNNLLTDPVFETVITTECQSLPKNLQYQNYTFRTGSCIIAFDDLLCEVGGWRIPPDLNGFQNSKNGIGSFRRCDQMVTFYSRREVDEQIHIPLSSTCRNVPGGFGTVGNSLLTESCIQYFETLDCTGSYAILPGDTRKRRLGLEVASFRVCDQIGFHDKDNTRIFNETPSQECQSLLPNYQNQIQSISPEKCVVAFSKVNCMGSAERVAPVFSTKTSIDLLFNINSYALCDQVIKVFNQSNYQGTPKLYVAGSTCKNFHPEDQKRISSLQNENCVTLYSREECRGPSFDVCPGCGNDFENQNFEALSFRKCQSVSFYRNTSQKGLVHHSSPLSRDCTTLPSSLQYEIGSVKVGPMKDACVQLFSSPDCQGFIQDVYSGGGMTVMEHGVASYRLCGLQVYINIKDDYDEPNPREGGSVENYCKRMPKLHEFAETTVEVDTCTHFHQNSKCLDESIMVLPGENITLPSDHEWFFRSCIPTAKFLRDENITRESIMHEFIISRNCTPISVGVMEDIEYIYVDECIEMYLDNGCEGQGYEFVAEKLHAADDKKFKSLRACTPILRVYNRISSVADAFLYQQEATQQCADISLSETREERILRATGCIQLYSKEKCKGAIRYLKDYNEYLNIGVIKSYRVCNSSSMSIVASDAIIPYENAADDLGNDEGVKPNSTLENVADGRPHQGIMEAVHNHTLQYIIGSFFICIVLFVVYQLTMSKFPRGSPPQIKHAQENKLLEEI